MKYLFYLAVFVAISFVAVYYISTEYDNILAEKAVLRKIVFDDSLDLRNVADGIYVGKDSYVTLEVKIVNHKIDSIEILNNKPGDYAASAEKVTERVITAQSLDVDAISGATTTSKKILSAISAAFSDESTPTGEIHEESLLTPSNISDETDAITSASQILEEEQEETPQVTEDLSADTVTGASPGWEEETNSTTKTEDYSLQVIDVVNGASQSEDETAISPDSSKNSIDVTTGASQSL